MFKNILVAIDGSKSSTNALQAAAELSAKFGAEMHILHVVRDMQVPLNPGLMEAYEKLQRQRHDVLSSAGEQLINQAKRSVEARGIDAIKTDIGSGDPASAIVDYAVGNKIDPCLSGLHPHPLGLVWAQPGYRGARHGCSRPRRSPIPAIATRVPATFPR